MNHVIHIAAVVQLRHDTEGRAYYRRKLAAGRTPMEALRCLKRRISDVIYRHLVADARAAAGILEPVEISGDKTGPGGHCGATQESSAVDLPPHIDTSDQPLPGPGRHQPLPAHPDVQAMLDAGAAFSAWWSPSGPQRPNLAVVRRARGGHEKRA